MKNLGFWNHPLRNWQGEAFEATKAKQRQAVDFDRFMCEGVPGSGKTRFGMRVAHNALFTGFAKRLAILVPTDHLCKQWAIDAAYYGINLDPYFENNMGRESSEYHGIVTTYAAIGANPSVHANLTKSSKTLVIIDEIHHLGENKVWGDAVLYAFEEAIFKLCLSGTAFRSDKNMIPFIKYVNGVSQADYTYTYTQAIIDGVCRMVYFPAYNGKMEWRVDGETHIHTFDDALDDTQSSERLRTALDTDGDFMRELITAADKKLSQIRTEEFHSDAGGLITAIDQEHARRIQDLVEDITGEYPEIVISDDKQSSRKIKEFRDNARKWIVSCKMISEGVDIPRLRVGVYATNIRSELYFRQFVGRFVRVLAHLDAQDAFLFMPMDPVLLSFATQIETEREHALDKVKEKGTKEKKESDYEGEDPTPKGDRNKKVFEAVASEVTGSHQFEISFDDKVASMFNLPVAVATKVTSGAKIITNTAPPPLFEQKKIIREEINTLAKTYAKQKGNGSIDWDVAHKDWIRQGGKRIDDETLPELKKRKNWLQSQIN